MKDGRSAGYAALLYFQSITGAVANAGSRAAATVAQPKAKERDVDGMSKHFRFDPDRRRRPYWRDERLLGKTFVDKQQEAVAVIGKDVYTRQDLIDKAHCGNFAAALNLSKIAANLQVESLAQLVARYPMEELLQQRGFGLATAFVLMCLQEVEGFNPMKLIDLKPKDMVTITTLKHRALAAQHAKSHNKNGKRHAAA